MDLEPAALALLKVIATGRHSLLEIQAGELVSHPEKYGIPGTERHHLEEHLWALIAKRLVFLRAAGSGSPVASLSRKAHALINDSEPQPDDPAGYLRRIVARSPQTTDKEKLYLAESLKAFNADCYLASAMMLGVAAESAMVDTAAEFVRVFPTCVKLADTLQKRGRTEQKLEEFATEVEAKKKNLPDSLRQEAQPSFNLVLNVIRIMRNKIGHPSGYQPDETWCRGYLVLYEGAHHWLHALRDHLRTQP